MDTKPQLWIWILMMAIGWFLLGIYTCTIKAPKVDINVFQWIITIIITLMVTAIVLFFTVKKNK